MEEVGEVSSCTIDCDCVMMCMCVRVSASVSACLQMHVCPHAHLPMPRCVLYALRSIHVCSFSANLNPPTIILPISLTSLCATDTPFSK